MPCQLLLSLMSFLLCLLGKEGLIFYFVNTGTGFNGEFILIFKEGLEWYETKEEHYLKFGSLHHNRVT